MLQNLLKKILLFVTTKFVKNQHFVDLQQKTTNHFNKKETILQLCQSKYAIVSD
jgi:hypothetical protein